MRPRGRAASAAAGALLALVAVGTGPALAQREAVTGRWAPPPQEAVQRTTGRWSVSAGGGLLTSGDLFNVTATSLVQGRPPYGASEFRVTLDEDLLIALSAAYRARERWSVRMELGWSRVDATAEARVGQTVVLQEYDRLTFTLVGLSAEHRLLATRLYPYLCAGAALARLSAAEAEGLTQTRLGARLGAGLQVELGPAWGARAEIRDTICQFDSDRHAGSAPGIDAYEELGPQHLFEVIVAMSVIF